ncbi:uncharacterized protein LOC130511277 [Raphanus sativus]|uniref:Uncharacterized protein LOC130511277 n=1 Tax=Raphanus sativus TaxID=3726 RepID=A0A9W3DJV4_RAPSA|nr:uncharacterized protein LOC130511277 [Raphanus sativus]
MASEFAYSDDIPTIYALSMSMFSCSEEKIEACLQFCFSSRLTHYQDLSYWILWRLWKSRNVLIFQNKSIHWRSLLSYATNDATEWSKVKATIEDNTGSGVVGRHARQRSHWTRPSEGWVKCNVDGSFIQNYLASQAGWIYRDNRGTYRGAVQAMGGQVQNPLECELQAILMAIQHSWSLGYQKVIVESDCKKAVRRL